MIHKKGKLSGRPLSSSTSSWTGLVTWRVQSSWRIFFLLVVFLLLATTTLMIDQVFQAARTHSVQLVKGLPTVAIGILPRRIVEDELSVLPDRVPLPDEVKLTVETGLVSVRDIVAFPEEVMLVVETVGGSGSSSLPPSKDNLVCLFGQKHRTGIFSMEWKDDHRSLLAVRCEHPPQEVLLTDSKEATLLFKDSNFILPSAVEYSTNSSWKPLVYESVSAADSVLLLVKGLVDARGKPDNYSTSLDKLYCVFGSDVKSRVRLIAQEVVRCELPPVNAVEKLKGAQISLFVPKMGVLRSVAYFDPPLSGLTVDSHSGEETTEKKFHLCSCTMLWNQAPFLREWIIYHGFLGIERWFLYDNNSDDDIEEVLGSLQPAYNVSRHAWPWIKTQEAGFSHCALRARAVCKWVLFVDVDEFVYPKKDLNLLQSDSSSSVSNESVSLSETAPSLKSQASVLGRLIDRTLQRGEEMGKNVGEVRLLCHNFGPSGLSRAPEEGVMVGYTCRMQWPQRHKSFILLDAMSDSLMNVVHHFALRDGYKEMAVHARIGVVNHYKFQAWEVFKAKFVRRVATYVVDWREQSAHSNDRAPGLGLEAVEPADWPSRYCEEEDWGLRNFTWNNFRDPETNLMPWQHTSSNDTLYSLQFDGRTRL